MSKRKTISFQVSISGRDDGTIAAVYVVFSHEAAAYTTEIVESELLADYNDRDELIGIEILAPVRLRDLTKLVDKSVRDPFRKFVKKSVPSDFVYN